MVLAETPPFSAAFFRASSACMASGMIHTGFFIRACMVCSPLPTGRRAADECDLSHRARPDRPCYEECDPWPAADQPRDGARLPGRARPLDPERLSGFSAVHIGGTSPSL